MMVRQDALRPAVRAEGPAPGPASFLVGPLPTAVSAAGAALFVSSIPPVPDHAYQFHLAERMLDGAVLYVDIAAADMHPPLFTWFAIALEFLGRLLGTTGLQIYPLFVALAALAIIFLVWRIGPRSPVLLAILAFAVLPLSGPYFGQGEHLALLFALPYLLTSAATEETRFGTPVQRIAIAALAAFGMAMKPHFALIWIVVEIYRARHYGIASLRRMENLTIAGIFVAYMLATALIHPEFYRLIPWLMELYPQFGRRAMLDIVMDGKSLLLVAALFAARAVRGTQWSRLADVLSLAAVAAYAAMLIQLKGWGYHWYPVNALSALLLGLGLRAWAPRLQAVIVPAIALATLLLASSQPDRTARALVIPPAFLPQMMDVMERHANGRPVVSLTQHMEAGFPLATLTGVSWPSPYAHLWMIPALYRMHGNRKPSREEALTPRWASFERNMVDRVWESMNDGEPVIAIVETAVGGLDMRRYLEGDARFRAWFASAAVLDTVGFYIVYGAPVEETRP